MQRGAGPKCQPTRYRGVGPTAETGPDRADDVQGGLIRACAWIIGVDLDPDGLLDDRFCRAILILVDSHFRSTKAIEPCRMQSAEVHPVHLERKARRKKCIEAP